MSEHPTKQALPIAAQAVPLPKQGTQYPQPFAARVAGRDKRKLGAFFGLQNFGVNLTTLAPLAVSSIAHHHSQQDEFIYIIEGEATLMLDGKPHIMRAGDCIGLPAGTGVAHQLVNRSDMPMVYLEIGDKSPNDKVVYPFDDLALQMQGERMVFTHKNGEPYP